MGVVAAAVCPHPPIVVPELASGAAAELEPLRVACRAALDALSSATSVLVVGSGPVAGTYAADAGGSFGPYGAPDVRIGSGPRVLPLSLTVGGWLLERSKAAGLPRTYLAVPADETPERCLEIGHELAAGNDRIGLLVMGDGSARRSDHAPVHLHPRAEIFDTTVAKAFQNRDLDVLAALDPDLATVLQAAGRAPWQVLAGALAGTTLNADLLYDAAPYGVGYFVASFT
ncbi:class III extradiol dioxygenase subunit B-like domain-containing protein [Kribbella sp. NPDC059898]|uniref:class III extradiol dioxygenase subunit B-like domain-containing protein n=1 Tax=Kribbella sp. NPDC059898 TaxID=3346995 RepID=UPI00365C05EA